MTAIRIVVTLCLLSALPGAAQQPDIVSRGTTGGRGYPFGTTDTGEFTPLKVVASDPDYAYTREKPVKLGPQEGGPSRSRLFLNGLRGPAGQVLTYERKGSCCGFETPASDFGMGLLDVYELTYEGLSEPIVLYINIYDAGDPQVPHGLTARTPG